MDEESNSRVIGKTNPVAEQALQALGLGTVCVQVYLAMHAAPNTDAMSLATRLGLSVAEVTDAVDTLFDLTLLRPGVETSSRLRPVSIERAVHTLIRQQTDQLKAQADSLAMLQSAVQELLASPIDRRDMFDQIDIETVAGVEAAQTRLEELALRTTDSLWSMLPGGPVPREMLEAVRPFDEEAAQRGVKFRLLYQSSIRAAHRNMEYARWMRGLGAEVRCTPVLPQRMMVMDQSIAVLTHRQGQLPVEMFVIREPAILGPLIALFEISWNAAEALEIEVEQKSAEPASAQELALLRLLAAGGTDEAAAKKLGVSVRTVRRIMADLMERLDASSRFEAGHKATQRGWL